MDGMSLLQKAHVAGLTVQAQDDRLVIKGSKRAESVVRELSENKAAVLAALAARSTTETPVIDPQNEHVGLDAEPASRVEERHQPPAAQENTTHGVANESPTNPTQERCNVAYCDVLRLSKAMLAAVITLGNELTAAEGEMGSGFAEFVVTRTPLKIVEARTLIRFAAEVGLQPDALTAAIAVPLSRMFEAVAVLGKLFLEEQGL